MTKSIQRRIADGASWMLLFKLADRGLAFVSTIVLARLLVPEDFGLVAMAMSVIALIELASSIGIEVPLIQRAAPTRVHYDTAWTLRMLFGLGAALLMAILALPTAAFYEDPRLTGLMLVLALAWLVDGFENIGVVNFRRELDFRREFTFMLAKRLTGVAVTLAVAVATRSYWALVAGTLAGRCAGVALSYAMQSYRPRLALGAWRELIGFSGWLMLTNVLLFLNGRLSHFVIGRTQGPAPLGVFTIANDVAALASSEITGPINRAILPGLARWSEQAGGVGPGLLRIASTVQFITMPAAFGLAAVAEPLVLTLLGPKWTEAVVPVQILAFAGALQSLSASNHAAYLAVARPFVPAVTAGAGLAALIPLLYLFHDQGVVGIAWAHLGAMVAAFAVSMTLMHRFLDVSLWSLLRASWRPLVAAASMGVTVFFALRLFESLWPGAWAAVELVVGVATGAATYLAVITALWLLAGRPDGPERLLIDRLRGHGLG